MTEAPINNLSCTPPTPGTFGAMPQPAPRLPPVQQRMYDLLRQQPVRARSSKELHECLFDELSGPGALRTAVARLKVALRPHGQDVFNTTTAGVTYYCLVRLTASPYNE